MLEDKVSILMPVHNASAYLIDTLESAVTALQKHDQIIVIDDHSSDGSFRLAQDFLKTHHQNHVIQRNQQSGACSARNLAFQLSNGSWIQWLDADDLIAPNKLSSSLSILKKNIQHLVVCPWHPFIKDVNSGVISDDVDWNKIPSFSTPGEWLARDTFVGLHCYAGHRSLFEKAGPWDESLAINQDGEYFTRVVACSKGVHFTRETQVFYRRHSHGSVSRFTPEKADSLFRSTESMASTVLKVECSTRMNQMIANRWQHFIYTVYPNRLDLISKAESQLKSLPCPTIKNPNAVSNWSRLFAAIFGWKMLNLIRGWRSKIHTCL